MDFEKNLKRLEEVVRRLQDGDISLEESVKLYEEGVRTRIECNQKLGEAEQKVKMLMGLNPDGSEVVKDFVVPQS